LDLFSGWQLGGIETFKGMDKQSIKEWVECPSNDETGKHVFEEYIEGAKRCYYCGEASTLPIGDKDKQDKTAEDYKPIGQPLDDYIRDKHTQQECIGFIDGWNACKHRTAELESKIKEQQKLIDRFNMSAIDVGSELHSYQAKIKALEERLEAAGRNFFAL